MFGAFFFRPYVWSDCGCLTYHGQTPTRNRMSTLNSYRPYLIRALHDWICDNGLTPHLLVDADMEGVVVPPSAVQEGRVVLNIAPRAVVGFNIDQDYVSFSARFGGVSQDIWVPISAVLAIYARENGQGMVIPDDPREPAELERIADEDDLDRAELQDVTEEVVAASTESKQRPSLAAVPNAEMTGERSASETTPSDNGDDEPPKPPKPPKAPFLRVVK